VELRAAGGADDAAGMTRQTLIRICLQRGNAQFMLVPVHAVCTAESSDVLTSDRAV
jgi:hypothetical protein